ncbi:MAG: hypothetical protein ACR2JK_00040 [Geodermatophilaceae bacterium]
MSFLGGGKGFNDPELAAANRRQREHFARDINDQRTLAAGGEIPGHRKRSPWLLLAAVAAFFLLAAFFRGGAETDPVAIERSCTVPALVVEMSTVVGGDNIRVRSTGPQDEQYILTIDGEPIRGQADQEPPYTSTPEGPAYSLLDCVSPSFLIPSPVQAGEHKLELVAYGAAGAETVATVTLTVTD